MDITLLKLGGSLITDKNKPYTTKPHILEQVLSEFKNFQQKNPENRFIIGHGAGSFAHVSAKKYNTINGISGKADLLGACAVHADAMKLHQIVLEEAMRLGIPVFSLQPAAFLLAKEKNFLCADFSILAEILRRGFIPLIFGDVIIDAAYGATIFSTDMLFSILVDNFSSGEFTIKKIIHAGNYDGVSDDKKKVIPHINSKNFPELKKCIGNSGHTDVTGGMLNKVQESLKIAGKGIISQIINGAQKDNLSKVLSGDSSIGTCISNT